jgi:hypothetical protein
MKNYKIFIVIAFINTGMMITYSVNSFVDKQCGQAIASLIIGIISFILGMLYISFLIRDLEERDEGFLCINTPKGKLIAVKHDIDSNYPGILIDINNQEFEVIIEYDNSVPNNFRIRTYKEDTDEPIISEHL